MRGEPAEDQGHELLPIDVAACVAVFVDLHGCTIFRVVQEPSGERLLQGADPIGASYVVDLVDGAITVMIREEGVASPAAVPAEPVGAVD